MRKTGLLAVALMSMLGFAPDASATFISAAGTFQENNGGGFNPDDLTLSNDALSGANITTIVMDLSGSGNNAVFDPSDYIFTDISTDSTGFDGSFSLNGNQELTLVFNLGAFEPGETFAFQVDIDDGNGNGQTTGADFAGSIFTASFSGATQNLVGTYVDDGGNNASASASLTTPEPGTLSTFSLGLIALAAARRGRQHNRI